MDPARKNLVIIRAITDQGLTVSQAATKYGVSRQWIYTLLARYRQHGPDGLTPQPRTPRTRPTTSTPIQERILALRDHLTATGADNGADTIAFYLTREGFHTPAPATIHRILRAGGRITPQPKKRPKTSYQRFEADLPNETRQADITHVFLTGGRRIEVLDFLDDHSRYLLHATCQQAFTGADVVTTMRALISRYGPPQSTLTDNGLVFTARLAGRRGARNGFEKLLQAEGITQKNGRGGHPQTQGKIERFHQTLKRWLAARPPAATLTELQTLLDNFTTWYNHERPHRAIGRRTPAAAYTARPKATPTPKDPSSAEWRTRTDQVDAHGKVSLRYAGKMRHLGYGRANRGRKVLILIHDNHVVTSDAGTGEVIAEHTINPDRDYQPPLR